MAQQFTFPQTGDRDDAEHFAAMIGQDNLADFVADGLSFTYNSVVPDVDVATGKVFIQTASSVASSSGDTILKTNHVVQVPAQTVSLTDNDVNYIYVEPDLSTDDNATVSAFTAQQSGDVLLIGTIDTTADTVELNNRDPNAIFNSAKLPDDKSLLFGTGDDYSVFYDSAGDRLSVEDSASNPLLDILDTDFRVHTSAQFDGAVDINNTVNLDSNFTFDGAAGGNMNLAGNMKIADPELIEFGTSGNALKNSNPDNVRNNIHITGTGGTAYPYNDDFENWVFHARDGKGDIVFMNYNGAGTGIPFLSMRYDEQTVRAHRPLDVDASATFSGNITLESGASLTMDGPNGAGISTVDRIRWDSGPGQIRAETAFTTYGADYQVRFVDSATNPIMGFRTDLSVQLYNDLVDSGGGRLYDETNGDLGVPGTITEGSYV